LVAVAVVSPTAAFKLNATPVFEALEVGVSVAWMSIGSVPVVVIWAWGAVDAVTVGSIVEVDLSPWPAAKTPAARPKPVVVAVSVDVAVTESEPADSPNVGLFEVPANAVVEPFAVVVLWAKPAPRPAVAVAPPTFATSVRLAVAAIETALAPWMIAPPVEAALSPSFADCELESEIWASCPPTAPMSAADPP
jgi:hypothetical protein